MKEALEAYQDTIEGEERRVIDLLVVKMQNIDDPLRLCNWDRVLDIDVGDGYGVSLFPPIPFRRSEVTTQADLTIDDVTIEMPNLEIQLDVGAATPSARKVSALGAMGVFDDAEVSLYQYDYSNDLVFHHSDWIISLMAAATRVEVRWHLQSWVANLDRRAPKTIMQEQCNNSLFDFECGVDPTAHQASGTCIGGTFIQAFTTQTEADNYWDLGYITFTSGANPGASRQIIYYARGSFMFDAELPYAVSAGDEYTVRRGCNKTLADCQDKYGNLPRYRGCPYIPSPEVLV